MDENVAQHPFIRKFANFIRSKHVIFGQTKQKDGFMFS